MQDKVAFISGGGSGIGRAASSVLAGRGARVAVAGRTLHELEDAASSIRRAGGSAIVRDLRRQ